MNHVDSNNDQKGAPSLTAIFESSIVHTIIFLLSSWWFQPISKILVELDHFPK